MITVCQVLEATEGGTRRHLRDLVGALDPGAFRCALAVSRRRDPAFAEDLAGYAERGVPVIDVPMRRGIAPLADLLSLLRLVRGVRRIRPDVIHAHSSKAGFLARLAGLLCGVPVVYTPHVFPFLMDCGRRRRRVYRGLERLVRGLTRTLIAVSAEEEREAFSLGYPRDRVALIRNGLPRMPSEPVRVRDDERLTVGFFGRLTRQKGADVLLDAAAEVVAHLPHTRFALFGDGELAPDLHVQAERLQLGAHVAFKGAFRQGDAERLMREVDVVVLPSRWEGCPYVLLEAFRAGVPVVASLAGGVTDLLQPGVNGVGVAPGDSEALEDGLLEVLRDASKRGHLAEHARSAAMAWDASAMAQAVGEVYRRACGRPA